MILNQNVCENFTLRETIIQEIYKLRSLYCILPNMEKLIDQTVQNIQYRQRRNDLSRLRKGEKINQLRQKKKELESRIENLREEVKVNFNGLHKNYWKIKEIRMKIRKEQSEMCGDSRELEERLKQIEKKIEREERETDKRLFQSKEMEFEKDKIKQKNGVYNKNISFILDQTKVHQDSILQLKYKIQQAKEILLEQPDHHLLEKEIVSTKTDNDELDNQIEKRKYIAHQLKAKCYQQMEETYQLKELNNQMKEHLQDQEQYLGEKIQACQKVNGKTIVVRSEREAIYREGHTKNEKNSYFTMILEKLYQIKNQIQALTEYQQNRE